MFEIIKDSYKLNRVEKIEHLGKVNEIDFDYLDKYEKCYCVNNGVVVFRYNSENYVRSCDTGVRTVFRENGFEEKALYVPFSNWDKPVDRMDEYNRVFRKVVKENV